ncbi:MAG: alpha-L-arabinofuranosidase C-terminal domain-containing protein [bacterium]
MKRAADDKTTATITIDANSKVTKIDPMIYGHFIEHLDGCIYGGLLEKRRTEAGWRWEIRNGMMEKIKAIRPPVIRWPGGLYADGYHWRDGIGAIEKRRTKPNYYWRWQGPIIGPPDPNHFGTDEFIAFCRAVGAEPYININYATGTIREAVEWVEYVNRRKRGGRRSGTGTGTDTAVKYWGIGNEIYGLWAFGHTTPQGYAKRYIKFCKAMKAVDPNIRFVAVGNGNLKSRWNRVVLEIASEWIDLFSIHIYLPGPEHFPVYFAKKLTAPSELHYSMAAAPIVVEKTIEAVYSTIMEIAGRNIPIALDEWNVWAHPLQLTHGRYTLTDAIFAACTLHILQRKSGVVGMANIAQLVNVLGVLQAGARGIYESPIYKVFKLFADSCGGTLLKCAVESEKFSAPRLGLIPELKDVPYIDANATARRGGDVVLTVVNRHYSKPIAAKIRLRGFKPRKKVWLSEITADSPQSRNYYSREDVGIDDRSISVGSTALTHIFPPHSITAMIF